MFERRESSVLVGLIAIMLVGIWVDAGQFLTLGNINFILRGAAITAIIGYGVALLMVTGEFDLSVGSLYGLTAGMTAFMIGELARSPLFATVLVLMFALIYGITQGILVTKLNLPSLIVTIGTLTLVRGTIRVLSITTITAQNNPRGILNALGGTINLNLTYQLPLIHSEPKSFQGFSLFIVWMVILLFVFHYVLFYTRFGHHARATGDNVESVDTTGIDPEIIKIACFGIVGLVTAFAGLAYIGRFGSASTTLGSGRELLAIAAVVLGGTKLTGGEGSMVGTLLGALVLSTANNVLRLAGLGITGWQNVIVGGFIIAAIGLNVLFQGFSFDLIRSWYVTPLGELIRSPRQFFDVKSIRKTTSDMFGFLFISITATAVVTLLSNAIATTGPVESLVFVDGAPNFRIFIPGGFASTLVQLYLTVMVLSLLAFAAIEIVTGFLKSEGDYEDTLGVVAYSTAPAPLFALPATVFGYKLIAVGNALVTGVIAMLPALLLMLWLIYAGVSETHELQGNQALATVAGVALSWAGAIAFLVVMI